MKIYTLIFAASLYWPFPSYGQAQAPSQEGRNSNQANSAIPNPAVAAQSETVTLTQGNEPEPHNEQNSASNDAPTDNRIVWLTLALVFVGCAQVYVYCRQAGLMRDAIDQSKESSERGLRAYINVISNTHDVPNLDRNVLRKLPQGISLLSTNGGQTPAYKVVVCSSWQYFKGKNVHWDDAVPFLTAEEINALKDEPRGSLDTVGSGRIVQSDITFGRHRDGTEFQVAYDGFMLDQTSLFFYGTILYQDIFKRDHYTNYCVRVMKVIVDGKPMGSFTAYDRHTDAD